MSYPQGNREPAARPSRLTPSRDIGAGAGVVLAFHGLMCLCHHQNGFCEVGVVNTDPGAHDLRVFVMEVSPQFDPPANPNLGQITPVRVFTLSDTGRGHTDTVAVDAFRPRARGVTFFQPDGQPNAHPNDFRHVPDLEGSCFYDGELTGKVQTAFGPRLRVSDALFYTLCRTSRPFRAREEGSAETCPLGPIARVVGANIYLKSGWLPGHVTLRINGVRKIRLKPSANKKYLVFVDNSCPRCGPGFNDFPLYYAALKPPAGRKKILLEQGTGGGGPSAIPTPSAGLCSSSFVDRLDQLFGLSDAGLPALPSSDDAPCGPAVTGRSATLDA
ncbi:MAG TPA: hypothetical protein VF659_10940 [Pyrinomonadaceae bacterium]|jgi:hypothetical protein